MKALLKIILKIFLRLQFSINPRTPGILKHIKKIHDDGLKDLQKIFFQKNTIKAIFIITLFIKNPRYL